MIEQFRQMFGLLEDNQRVVLYPGGHDMKNDVVAIVMIEIVGNQLFTHQLLEKSMVEITTYKAIAHTDQHSLD